MSKKGEKDKRRAAENKRARLTGKLMNHIEAACEESRNGIAKGRPDAASLGEYTVYADLVGQLSRDGGAVLKYWNDTPTWELEIFTMTEWLPCVPKSALEKLAGALDD